MQMDAITSDLELNIRFTSDSDQNSSSDVKQYIAESFILLAAELKNIKSVLDFVKTMKSGMWVIVIFGGKEDK